VVAIVSSHKCIDGPCMISVAERLLELGEVNFASLSLRVVRPTLKFDSDTDDGYEELRDENVDDDNFDDAATTVNCSVIVRNIPKSLSKDYLTMFLENNRRSGGGEVVDVALDQRSATAVVTFASPQGKEHFLLQCQINFVRLIHYMKEVQ